MTTPTAQQLLALAERVEGATEGGAELDKAVALTAFPNPNGNWISRPYTTSLDAALSLVPEGWYWSAIYRDTPLGPRTGEGVVHNNEMFMSGRRVAFDVFARTPALALTAGCLRALALLTEGSNG